MRVAVLCGGKGTRLGAPVKCLAEVAGRPFLDWKLDELERHGATDVTLIVGPHGDAYRKRYGARCVLWADPGIGVARAIRDWPDDAWWCNGDTLLDVALWAPAHPVMVVRRDEHPNIAGLYLDCGLYFGKAEHRLVETTAVPWHINTPDDLGRTDAHLLRQCIAG